jgi:putative tryptophan/tyrosine transport system substrate-binding protein
MRMRRRDFITLLTGAAIAGPPAALAQTPPKIFRLGTLAPGPAIDEKNPLGATLLKALEQRGYALGKNLSLEPRGAGGQVGKLDELVRELKAKEVDVIVAAGYPVVLACKRANVPTVVAFGGGDPVATNLIDSLARPGGSITGISDDATTLSTKRLALIKQAVPNLQRVAMLWHRSEIAVLKGGSNGVGQDDASIHVPSHPKLTVRPDQILVTFWHGCKNLDPSGQSGYARANPEAVRK